MDRATRIVLAVSLLASIAFAGCASPYHADRGALFGGLTGAGVGAIAGHALGNTGAGAAIGAGVGALTGAAVGSEMDQMEARNRAAIAAQLGRQVAAGAVSIDDVVAMTHAGVNEELIVNHVRAHGMVRPLQTSDLIALQNQRISTRVIAAMQETPAPVQRQPETVIVQQPAPAPIIVEEYHYGHPYYYGYGYGHGCGPHYYHPRPAVGVGVTFR